MAQAYRHCVGPGKEGDWFGRGFAVVEFPARKS
jgi:hypothetical protein